MGFDIGTAITGAVQGFLETGNPYAAGAMGVIDGFSGSTAASSSLGSDTLLSGGSDPSSLMAFAQLAEASG